MINNYLESIGSNIRAMREYNRMTQGQLAEKSGLRRATISDIESGKLNFEINTLVKVASALNCYLDVILQPMEE